MRARSTSPENPGPPRRRWRRRPRTMGLVAATVLAASVVVPLGLASGSESATAAGWGQGGSNQQWRGGQTATPTATSTATPTTATPTATATSTPSATSTSAPSATSTATPTPSSTATLSPVASSTTAPTTAGGGAGSDSAASVAVTASTATAAPTSATGEHTVTFVNASGKKIWIGSGVNADGSQNFTGLPSLDDKQSATVTIPEASGAGHWRGKFFARQDCSGTPGSTFSCAVGNCGASADTCTTGEQPVSLAEFNFDPSDALAPWYDVSYVNAVSLPITITPNGATSTGGSTCAPAGCPEPLLSKCPADDLQKDAAGQPLLCVNPNRDAHTDYSDAISAACPEAYSWSKNDAEDGNHVMPDCPECSGFTVTFHAN